MGNRFNDIDLMITEDGDLYLQDGDLVTVNDLDYVVQMVLCRLKSVGKDWFYDNTGCDIEGFIGKPNTRENADTLTQKIMDILTSDAFCDPDDIHVLASPMNATKLIVGVFVKTEFQPDPLEFYIDFNFLTGFKLTRP